MNYFGKARELLKEFKGDAYLFGKHVLPDLGERLASAGQTAALIR